MSEPDPLKQRADEAAISVSPSERNPSPLSAFRALSGLPLPFILGGAPCPGHRYSLTGAAPFMTLSLASNDKFIKLENAPSCAVDLLKKQRETNPLTALTSLIKALNNGVEKGPFPFNGGAVGFFSYDLKDSLFSLHPPNPDKRKKSLSLPLLNLGFYDNIYVYDHEEERGYIISRSPETESARAFSAVIEGTPIDKSEGGPLARDISASLESNTTKEEYLHALSRVKKYIADGDIYQINLSQRLETPFTGDAFNLYEELLRKNSTPFSSFFDLGGFQVISNSPERLIKVSGNVMETCPIKGTLPRGSTPAEDRAQIKKLASNIKERAEHVMIVDLERNDLGRVARPGTVSVDNFQEIKTFSRLHHMVSTIRGEAPEDTDPFVILKNIFPGGSITGAPKIRAMEIIEELESLPRELYTGAAGFIDFSGDMDLSILIRTAIIKKGRLYLHVGGGIVADSVPLAEYDETILKAMDFLSLLKLRPEGLS